MSVTTIVIIVVAVLLVLWGVALYNNLVKLRNNRENAFANIDVQLKMRHDLVPQLVGAVKGYADHEKNVLLLWEPLRLMIKLKPKTCLPVPCRA